MVLLDVFVLAGLYTIRLIGGHEATKIEYSFWLLAFSVFMFLSLALLKRCTELAAMRQMQTSRRRRGAGMWRATWNWQWRCWASAAAFLAVLVMALYVRSPENERATALPVVRCCCC